MTMTYKKIFFCNFQTRFERQSTTRITDQQDNNYHFICLIIIFYAIKSPKTSYFPLTVYCIYVFCVYLYLILHNIQEVRSKIGVIKIRSHISNSLHKVICFW